jgi:structural maintenance of chromosome 2
MRASARVVWAPQDSATARRLAFDREVHCRCVTLEGDDFNPAGAAWGAERAVICG